MTFGRLVFLIGGIYGLVVVTPLYFAESLMNRKFPPAITHPEYYYGFVGAVVVWHLLFLVISRDPARYRAMMPVAVLEKIAFGLPAVVLYLQGRAATGVMLGGVVDLIFGLFFLLAFRSTPQEPTMATV